MSLETLKIVVPMAGLGTRLRPHTWSKPKQLVSVAGKAVLGHVMDTFNTLPDPQNAELVFIVGYLGDQIAPYMEDNYPDSKVHYVVQEDPQGQSHAIHMARHLLGGPMLMVFADTLIETDLSFLANLDVDGVAWVKPVPDPRRFGVAEVNEAGRVKRLIEKPDNMDNNLAVVGFYYFKRSEDLLEAIEEQMRQGIRKKGEFYLVDAINILLQRGMTMQTQPVEIWLDAGTPEALLDTNRYMLDHGRENSEQVAPREGLVVKPPVYIHPSAQIEAAVIGPYVSIGPGCEVARSVVADAILEARARVRDAVLERSIVGADARVQGRASIINIGDQSDVTL